MRRKTVSDGLRLLSAAIFLLILGTFYGREISAMLFFLDGGTLEFIQLAFFWGGILGGVGMIMICVGLLRAAIPSDRTRLLPPLAMVLIMLGIFCLLFARAFSAPPQQPLRPGETIVI